jgi:hypothetical protein
MASGGVKEVTEKAFRESLTIGDIVYASSKS